MSWKRRKQQVKARKREQRKQAPSTPRCLRCGDPTFEVQVQALPGDDATVPGHDCEPPA